MIFMIPVELGSLLGFGQASNMTIAILGKFENVRWNTSKIVVMPNILSYMMYQRLLCLQYQSCLFYSNFVDIHHVKSFALNKTI